MISIGINIGIDETERKSIGIISNLKSVVSPIPTSGPPERRPFSFLVSRARTGVFRVQVAHLPSGLTAAVLLRLFLLGCATFTQAPKTQDSTAFQNDLSSYRTT